MDKYQNKGSNPLILDKSGGAILKISYVKSTFGINVELFFSLCINKDKIM